MQSALKEISNEFTKRILIKQYVIKENNFIMSVKKPQYFFRIVLLNSTL